MRDLIEFHPLHLSVLSWCLVRASRRTTATACRCGVSRP